MAGGTTSQYSEVTICNLALSHCEQSAIVTLEQQNSYAAELCRLHYPICRDATIADHDWSCFSHMDTLSANPAAPLFGESKTYNLPGDCVRVRQVDRAPYDSWQVHGRVLHYSGDATVRIRYSRRLLDPTQYDPQFVQAFAYLLASALARPLTKSKNRSEALLGTYEAFVEAAKRANSQEATPEAFDGFSPSERLWTDQRDGWPV